MLKLGEIIRQKRRLLGMTQSELAGKLGVTIGYIGKIEIGQKPSFTTLAKIARILDIPTHEILTPDDELIEAVTDFANSRGKYDEDFSELHPKVKILLLEIAPIIAKYL